MERRFQTIMLSVLTAALLALASFIWNAQIALTTLSERLAQVSTDLSRASNSIQSLVSSAETKADHDRDYNGQQREITDHELRIRSLETTRRQR